MSINILLVGCGKMGGAMQARWQELSLYKDICIVEPSNSPVKSIDDIPSSFKPDIIVFAVKPQTLPDIIDGYKKYSGTLILSIAAGKPISFFERHLGKDAKIIRAMPNTPASIGKGISVACRNKNVGDDDQNKAEKLLAAVGEVMWVDNEKILDPVTALSGSGPAYLFYLMEVLEKAGMNIGLEQMMAEKLARQTVIGSAALADAEKNTSAAKLRENVTSPGGTTEAALKILMSKQGIQEIFNKALEAATKRAEELSK